MKKMAEITMELDCGGRIVTYMPCKGRKHFIKKMKKINKDGEFNFGHFTVDDGSVMEAWVKFHDMH